MAKYKDVYFVLQNGRWERQSDKTKGLTRYSAQEIWGAKAEKALQYLTEKAPSTNDAYRAAKRVYEYWKPGSPRQYAPMSEKMYLKNVQQERDMRKAPKKLTRPSLRFGKDLTKKLKT
jgi:hypothetical protein